MLLIVQMELVDQDDGLSNGSFFQLKELGIRQHFQLLALEAPAVQIHFGLEQLVGDCDDDADAEIDLKESRVDSHQHRFSS